MANAVNEKKTWWPSVLEVLNNVYGPYAFGIVSLVVLWLVMVQPTLEHQKIDFDTQQKIISSLTEVQRSQNEMASTMQQTAASLERTVSKLEAINETP